MTGDISWKGKDLTVPDFDPDALLSASGEKKGVFLAQMGPLLLPGPPFNAAARGLLALDNAVETDRGEGPVRTLVSTWTVKNGVFEAKDVALASTGHRVALKGRIDLPGERFDEITVALVDDRGCPLAGETIGGPFRLPRIALATFAKTIEPPGKMPIAQSKEPVSEEGCEVFYAGSVPPPE
jgi:AsmA protein